MKKKGFKANNGCAERDFCAHRPDFPQTRCADEDYVAAQQKRTFVAFQRFFYLRRALPQNFVQRVCKLAFRV